MVAPASIPGIHQSGTHAARPGATTVSAGAIYGCSDHRLIYVSDGTSWSTFLDPGGLGAGGQTFPLQTFVDGGGSTITTGSKAYIYVPVACTITMGVLLANQSGSISIEVRRTTYTAFDAGGTHPVTGDKISASAPLVISTATKSKDSTLTGWTKTLAADDVLELNVSSVTSIQRCTVHFSVTR